MQPGRQTDPDDGKADRTGGGAARAVGDEVGKHVRFMMAQVRQSAVCIWHSAP